MAEAAATTRDLDWGALQEERVMRLHGARRYLRTATAEAAKRVAGKLNEEIARGHDTIAFSIALGLAILKDVYDIAASLLIKKMAVGIFAAIGMLSAWAGAAAGVTSGAAVGVVGGGIACGWWTFGLCSVVAGAAGAVVGGVVAVATAVGGTVTGMGVSIGTHFVLSFMVSLVGLFLSLTLYFFLWGKGWFMQKMWIKLLWWIGTLFLDSLPVVRNAPINTLNVLNTWRLVRKRAHRAEKKLNELKKLTKHELEELDNDISKLDEEE